MIRFAIDIRMWNNSGIGNYLQNLVPIIIRNNPDYNFILYGNREILIREKISITNLLHLSIGNIILIQRRISLHLFIIQLVEVEELVILVD